MADSKIPAAVQAAFEELEELRLWEKVIDKWLAQDCPECGRIIANHLGPNEQADVLGFVEFCECKSCICPFCNREA